MYTDHRLWRSAACAEKEPPIGIQPCLHQRFPALRMKLLYFISHVTVSSRAPWVVYQNLVEFPLPALSSFLLSLCTDHTTSDMRHRFFFTSHLQAEVRCEMTSSGLMLLNWSLQSTSLIYRQPRELRS